MASSHIVEAHEGIVHLFSDRPGPIVSFVGGVHGNEATGIRVIQRLQAEARSGALMIERGELILTLGNMRAIEQGTRGSTLETDLNRCFTETILNGSSETYEADRARVLTHALRSTTVGVDIHATNKPSEPFLCLQPLPTPPHRRIAQHLNAKIILADPDFRFAGEPVTLDEYFTKMSAVGLCYETGYADDTSRVDEIYQELMGVLMEEGLVAPDGRQAHTNHQTIYRLTDRLILDERGFQYTEGIGAYNFQPILPGMTLGMMGNEPIIAQATGVIVFPKPEHLWRIGQPVGYLATKADEPSSS